MARAQRSRFVVAAFSVAALALASCVHERASELEPKPESSSTPALVLPPGYRSPVTDPTGTMAGWLDLRFAQDPQAQPTLQSLDLITPIAVVEGLVARARATREAGAAGSGGVDLGRRPVVVFIHGGTWQAGDKRGGLEAKAARTLGAGFLLASINYRLAPTFTHPAQVEDTAAALAWLHDHAPEYGGAPDRFVVVGHSAGAHLAALVATDERYLARHGLPLSLIAGVVSLDGAGYDLPDRTEDEPGAEQVLATVFGPDRAVWADASPVNHVAAGKHIPPFLLFQAGGREISAKETAKFSARLRDAGLRVDVVHADDRTHRTIHMAFGGEGDAVTTRFLEFAQEVTR